MAIKITIKETGLKEFQDKTKKINKSFAGTGFKKLHTLIGLKGLQAIDKQFKTDGSFFNTPWKNLSPATLEQRRKGPNKNLKDKILRDTGILRASFTFNSDAKRVIIGTTDERAPLHQFGGVIQVKSAERKKATESHKIVIPARPMLPTNDKIAYEKIAKPISEKFVINIVAKVNK